VTNVWLDSETTVYGAYQANGTPSAVLVGTDGRIQSAIGAGAEAISALVERATSPVLDIVRSARAPAAPPEPAPAPPPPLELPDLDGQPIPLADRSGDTLLLFWNAGCGFCRAMVDDLKTWAQAPPAGAPRMLVLAAGSAQENRELGLTVPILVDANSAAASAYGAGGTPSALLLDPDGRVVSTLAVGAPSVLALAARPRSTIS
jgi:cytochrome oxidase Cu insertion factor (SCO1/SenC/PrrC family)